MRAHAHKYATPYERGRLSLIAAVLPSGTGRALDIGCGTGEVAALLAARGFRTLGIDTDLGALLVARQRVPMASFELGDALGDLPDGPFDVVTACEVLEHFELHQQQQLLASIHRVLVPTGRLVLSTPNTASLMSIVGSAVYPLRGRRWDCGDASHRHVHSAHSLLRLLRESGFTVRRAHGFQLLLHRPWPLMAVGMRAFTGPLARVCYDLVVEASPHDAATYGAPPPG